MREPLVCLNGEPIREQVPAHQVRPATEEDLDACADVCRRVHGHDRTAELTASVQRRTARVVEQGGRVVGYVSELGAFDYCAALTNDGLQALIGNGDRISGPGMLLPSRNGERLPVVPCKGIEERPANDADGYGLYNERRGAFVPSILY